MGNIYKLLNRGLMRFDLDFYRITLASVLRIDCRYCKGYTGKSLRDLAVIWVSNDVTKTRVMSVEMVRIGEILDTQYFKGRANLISCLIK